MAATRKLATGAVVPGDTWVDLVDSEVDALWLHTVNRLTSTAGSSTAYTAVATPPFTVDTLTYGVQVVLVPHVACGASPTLNINGLGAYEIVKPDGTSDGAGLDAGDLIANNPYTLEFRTTYFFLLSSAGATSQAPADEATAMLFDIYDSLAAMQTIGTPDTPVTATVANNSTLYALEPPVESDGYLIGLDGYGHAAGALLIKRWTKSGDTFTQVAEYSVTIPVGLFSLTMDDLGYIPVAAGEYLGFYSGNPSRIGRSSGYAGNPEDFVWIGPTAGGNATSFTDAASSQAKVEMRFTVGAIEITEERVATAEEKATAAVNAISGLASIGGVALPPLTLLLYNGAWYDFSTSRDLYQDVARTTHANGDGAPVGGLYDRSMHGYNFSQATSGARPTVLTRAWNERNVLMFDGTQYLVGEKKSMTRNIERLTIIAAARRDDLNDTRPIIDHKVQSGSNTRVALGNYSGGGLKTRPAAMARQTDGGSIAFAYGPFGGVEFDEPGPGPWHIYTAEYDFIHGTIELSVDGQTVPEGIATMTAGATPDLDEANVYIGGTGDGTEWIGAIGEIVEIVGDVDGIIVRDMSNYLAQRWGVTYEHRPYTGLGYLPAIWTWFIYPRVWAIDASHFVVGGITQAGSVMTGDYDTATGTRSHDTLFQFFQQDDHDNPALIRGLDGKMIAAFSRHGNSAEYFIAKTTNTSPPFTWAAAVDIDTQIKPVGSTPLYSYANLVRLTGEANRLYNFFRINDTTSGIETWYVTWSNDDGATWVTAKRLWGANRPYTRVCANGANRIDIAVSESVGGNTWHCYYQADNLYKSNGTLIGPIASGPYDHLIALTTVHDKVALGYSSYHWDLVIDAGKPVIGYATFRGGGSGNQPYTDHRYVRAAWSGSAWVTKEVCTAGGWIGANPSYSGGMAIDPQNVNVVYASRRIDDDTGAIVNSVVGVDTLSNSLTTAKHKLFKMVTVDGGTTWTGTQVTFGDEEHIRPVIPVPGTVGRTLFYCSGRYGPMTVPPVAAAEYLFYDMTIAPLTIS